MRHIRMILVVGTLLGEVKAAFSRSANAFWPIVTLLVERVVDIALERAMVAVSGIRNYVSTSGSVCNEEVSCDG